MNTFLFGLVFVVALSASILVVLEAGRRIGARRLAAEGEVAAKGLGALEGAVFALLGLMIAFCFSGARRHLVVQEANAIGTAWLRSALLPPEAQPKARELFRRYLDSRIETYRKVPDMAAVRQELARSAGLQQEIWQLAISSSRSAGSSAAPVVLLPALNAMFDITTTRTESVRLHPPPVIFVMLGTLALACSLFAGYDMAIRKRLNPLHSLAFAVVLSVTVYVIVDLEYPRVGLIRMTDSDQVLVELRKTME
jgi:hypothetical protein